MIKTGKIVHSETCPIQKSIDIIGGKWKFLIIWNLKEVTLRYSELKKLLPNITHKMLTQELKDLEKNHIVKRTVYPVVPPKVEYCLTKEWISIIPILQDLWKWGEKIYKKLQSF